MDHQPPVPPQALRAPGLIAPGHGVLDPAALAALDAFVLAAASHCAASLAILSLDTASGHCFTARSHRHLNETRQEAMIVAELAGAGDYVEVGDLASERARDAVVVEMPLWRFYAAAPIGAPGHGFRGSLCVFDRQPRRLTEAQRASLTDLATATTQLLTRIDADTQSRHMADIIPVQSHLADADLDLDSFLDTVLSQMQTLTPAVGAAFVAVEHGRLLIKAGSGTASSSVGGVLGRDRSLAGLCVASGESFIADDWETDPRVDQALLEGANARSAIVAPLLRNGAVSGCVMLMAPTPRAFSSSHLQTLQLVAGMLGTAFELRLRLRAKRALLVERDRALDELASLQRRSQAAVNQSATGMALLSPQGAWIAVNPALCTLLGYSQAELIGQSGIALNPEDHREAAIERMGKLARGETNAYQLEKPYIRKDGSLVWVLQTITLVRSPDDQPEFLVAEFMDITARRAAEASIQEASRKLNEANRLLVMGEELAHVGHWRVDALINEVIWSDEVYRIHGRSIADGPPALEAALACYHPEDRHVIGSLAGSALSSGEGYTAELRIIRPGGEERVVRTVGQCEWDSEGKIIGIFGVFQDVTELRDIERRLDALTTRLLLATHAGQVGISELSYPDRKLYFDGVMAQLFGLGLDASALTEEECWGAVHPDDAPLLDAVIDACARGAPGYELEYRVVWPNGDNRYIQSRGTLVTDAAGMPARIVGTSWDVTEMRNLTAQLAAEKERAERANNAKSNFLAVMSHEIRTPMNGVMGMNALLLETVLTPQQRRMADAVRYSADALLTIIDDILDLSKLEAGRVDLETIDFDLAEVMDKVAEVMVPKAAAKGLQLSIERTFAESCWFRGDPARLRQILLNLVSNAVKFTETGRIVISASALPARDDRYRLWFEVRDTGIGISAESKQRLFRPFEQADATITRRFGGTGLGLSICKRLVEQMDGMIGVMDHTGGGSVFWFEIPLPAGSPGKFADPMPEQRPDATATPGCGHILVVEDNLVNIALASLLLEAKGYTVEVARNGSEAVVAAARGGFDLILMDMQMPVLDGLAATREIRDQGEYGRRVPIIAMTANAMKEDELRCLEAGMDDYVSKPIQPTRLDELVGRWLERRRILLAP